MLRWGDNEREASGALISVPSCQLASNDIGVIRATSATLCHTLFHCQWQIIYYFRIFLSADKCNLFPLGTVSSKCSRVAQMCLDECWYHLVRQTLVMHACLCNSIVSPALKRMKEFAVDWLSFPYARRDLCVRFMYFASISFFLSVWAFHYFMTYEAWFLRCITQQIGFTLTLFPYYFAYKSIPCKHLCSRM